MGLRGMEDSFRKCFVVKRKRISMLQRLDICSHSVYPLYYYCIQSELPQVRQRGIINLFKSRFRKLSRWVGVGPYGFWLPVKGDLKTPSPGQGSAGKPLEPYPHGREMDFLRFDTLHPNSPKALYPPP